MAEPRKDIIRRYLESAAEADPKHVSVDWSAAGRRVELSIEIEDGALRTKPEENAKSLMICIIKEHKRLERHVGTKLDICDVVFEPLERGTHQIYTVVKPR